MTRDSRDLERIDALLRAQAHAPAPAVAPAVLARLGVERRGHLRWLRPAGLAFAACVVLVGVGVGIGAGLSGSTVVAPPPVRTVHFALTAPEARTVMLVGDFNGWSPEQALSLRPLEGGRFVASLDLTPGRYEYAFLVDGQRVVPDPAASAFAPDGFGGTNSVLEL